GAPDGQADRIDTEQPRRPAALVADLSHQGQRPGAASLEEGPGAAVEQVAQGLVVGGIQEWPVALGPARLGPQASQALGVEGVEGVADGGAGTAQVAGDERRGFARGAGPQELTTAEGKRLGEGHAC